MLTAEAREKGLISIEEKYEIQDKRGKPLFTTIVVISIAAVLLAVLPLRGLRQASLHRQYHEHHGTVVGAQIPITTLGPGTHYLVRIRYPDWYGHTRTIQVMNADKLKPEENVAVVVSRTKPPWTSDGLEETVRNPRNSELIIWFIGGGFVGFLLGALLGMLAANIVEARLVDAVVKKRQQEKAQLRS